jgi:hypothetical protein
MGAAVSSFKAADLPPETTDPKNKYAYEISAIKAGQFSYDMGKHPLMRHGCNMSEPSPVRTTSRAPDLRISTVQTPLLSAPSSERKVSVVGIPLSPFSRRQSQSPVIIFLMSIICGAHSFV